MRFKKSAVLVGVLVVSALVFWARYGGQDNEEGPFQGEGLAGGKARGGEVADVDTVDAKVPLDGLVSRVGDEVRVRVKGESDLAAQDRAASVIELGFEIVEEEINGGSERDHAHVARQWKGRFSPPVDGRLWGDKGIRRIGILLPERGRQVVRIDEHRVLGDSRGVYVGGLEGSAKGSVLLSYAGRSLSGSVQNYVTGETWEIRNAGGGEQYLAIVDLESLGSCGACSSNE